MPGRGVDQILPHPSMPVLHEDYVKDARQYVRLAERKSGRIPRGIDCRYVWGDATEFELTNGRLIALLPLHQSAKDVS